MKKLLTISLLLSMALQANNPHEEEDGNEVFHDAFETQA